MKTCVIKCCLCRKTIKDYGNNSWPVVNDDVSRCCDSCNAKIIIPARLKLFKEKNKEREEK